jgi:hypothetical protein
LLPDLETISAHGALSGIMEKANEYFIHAAECRTMAARATNAEHKAMLLEMATKWENLGEERQILLRRKERIAAIESATPRDSSNR